MVDLVLVLQKFIYDNKIENLLYLSVLLLFSYLFLKKFQKKLNSKYLESIGSLEKQLHEIFLNASQQIKPFLILIIIAYSLSLTINIQEGLKKIFTVIFQFSIILQVVLIIQKIIVSYFSINIFQKSETKPELKTLYSYIQKFIQFTIWIMASLLFLSNVGYNINSLITSMGIGGVAIALAVQNILKDIFSGIVLLVNKPFQLGDYIKLNASDAGDVEHIGLKNTIIRTTNKEELIIPNSDILNSRIYNFRSREKRRVSFKLYFDLSTTSDKLKTFKEQLLEILLHEKTVDKDSSTRVYLNSFNEFSCVFQVSFFLDNPSFKDYVDTLDSINFKIKSVCEELQIAHATNNYKKV